MAERAAVFAIPGDLASPTGGYAYARRLFEQLPACGWALSHLPLGEGYPAIDGRTARVACERLAALAPGVPVLMDGLALGVLPQAAGALAARSRLVALVHHPLALESGLSPTRAAALRQSERAALAGAAMVVATSRTTALTLRRDYAVPEARLLVAVPGTDPAPPAIGADYPEVALLSVGSLVPRKGHDVLLRALARCVAWPWRLTVVGDDTRDAQAAAQVRALAGSLGLGERVRFTGAVDPSRLEALYSRSDLFVLASRHEGYGMAGTEAIARGLPVVSTTAGAIPEALPPAACRLVPPDDPVALAEALAGLLADPAARRRLAAAAIEAAASLPRWHQTAAVVAHALERAMEG